MPGIKYFIWNYKFFLEYGEKIKKIIILRQTVVFQNDVIISGILLKNRKLSLIRYYLITKQIV